MQQSAGSLRNISEPYATTHPSKAFAAPESTRRDRTLDATLQTSFLRAASRFGKLASPSSAFSQGGPLTVDIAEPAENSWHQVKTNEPALFGNPAQAN